MKEQKETEDLKLSRKSKFVTQMVEILNKRKRQKLRQIIFFQEWSRVIKSEKVTEMVKQGKNLDQQVKDLKQSGKVMRDENKKLKEKISIMEKSSFESEKQSNKTIGDLTVRNSKLIEQVETLQAANEKFTKENKQLKQTVDRFVRPITKNQGIQVTAKAIKQVKSLGIQACLDYQFVKPILLQQRDEYAKVKNNVEAQLSESIETVQQM